MKPNSALQIASALVLGLGVCALIFAAGYIAIAEFAAPVEQIE
jgi:hypothetical protein